jgi:hypothetical protein
MELTWQIALLLAGLASTAAAVQGFTGMGFALVAMSLCSMLVGPHNANVLWTLIALPVPIIMAARLRNFVHWKLLGWCLLGAAAGLPLGVHVLAITEPDLLMRIFGGIILVIAIYYLVNPHVERQETSPMWGIPAGVLSGFLGGLSNMSGPPIALLVIMKGLKKNEMKGTMACYFLVTILYKIPLLVQEGGLLTFDHVFAAGILTIPVLLGVGGGMYAARFVSTRLIRRLICVLLIIPALLMLIP